MRKIAIMQPYFLPYIGYFQLMAAVDRFVVFDDVNYINRGWVNRNRLLINDEVYTFTVPLRGASQNRLICDLELTHEDGWRDKLMRTIQQAYAKATYYKEVVSLLERIVRYPRHRLDDFLLNSLREIVSYLELSTEIVGSSRIYGNAQLRGQERIIDICRQERAECYVNAIGGEALYERARFIEHGVELKFLHSRPLNYAQSKGEFVPWLSIVDVLMRNPKPEIQRMLTERELV